MLQRKNWLIILTTLVLILALAACGGDKEETSPSTTSGEATSAPAQSQPAESQPAQEASQPTAAPTATPVPPTPTPEPTATPTPEPEEELSSEFQRIQDVVNAYRSKGSMTYRIEGLPEEAGAEANVDVSIESFTEWVKADNPYGFNLHSVVKGLNTMQSAGEDTPSDMEIYMVDNNTYMRLGDQWMTLPRSEDEDTGIFDISPDEILTGAEDLKKVGTETINGIPAIHYHFDKYEDYDKLFNGVLNNMLDETQYTVTLSNSDMSGDLWIAKDGGYPVKFDWDTTITFDVQSKTSGESFQVALKSTMSTEISDVNADITIEPPEEVASDQGPAIPGFENEPFPLPEKTTLQGAFGDIITYSSELPMDEVIKFYNDALTSMGWSKEGDDMAATWSKDGHQFMLMIDPEDNGTSITILADEQ